MEGKQYSRKEKNRLYRRLFAVLGAFVLICVAGIALGHRVDNQKMDTGEKAAAADMGTVTINGVKCKPNWDVETYLFIGEDARGVKQRKTQQDGTGQSDVLELLVLDTKNHTYY
ncbi:MAG: hypothetical protein MR867_02040, partial [Eubacterium sp.]|nr:hypothetical protein [Eubacterium sp.]